MMAVGPGRRVSRRQVLASAGTLSTLVGAGCVRNPRVGDGPGGTDEPQGQIKIAGSSTVFPLAVQVRKEFQEVHPDVDVSIKSTGTGGGFANHFCPGTTDFNNASRPITTSERRLCEDSGVEPVELKVATDAMTVVVNPAADWLVDDCISVDELRTIWSPDQRPMTWQEVNDDWPDEEINLFGPTDASGTFDYFTEAILGEEGRSRTDYQATEQDNTIITGVAKNRYALGYLGFAYYSRNEDAVTALAVNDGKGCVSPSLETTKSGQYTPLSRPLYTYVARASLSNDAVATFARYWIHRSTSTKLVADTVGYVPNSEQEQREQRQRLHQALVEVTS